MVQPFSFTISLLCNTLSTCLLESMNPVSINCQKKITYFPKQVRTHYYNAISMKGTCIVNSCCQFSQQACTNFMQTYLYSLILTHFFILKTNLHCRIFYCYCFASMYVNTEILADLLHEISFSWATISAIWANITASSMSLCKSGFSNSIQLYWTIKKPRDRCHQLRSLSAFLT